MLDHHHREKLKLGGVEGDQSWHGEHQTLENVKRARQVLLFSFFICFLSLKLILYKT